VGTADQGNEIAAPPGISLGTLLHDRGPLTPDEWLPLARQIALRMRAAHEEGVRPGDLTPGTLLLRNDDGPWQVTLLDFGLAAEHTLADDVRAFGRTCYCALLGTTEPNEAARATLPEPWRQLLMRCTAPRGEERLADFAAVLDLLSLLNRPKRRRPAGGWSRRIGELLCLVLIGTVGGAFGEAVLAKTGRTINGVSVMMAVGTGSAFAAALVFGVLAALGHVVFGAMVAEVEPPDAAETAASVLRRLETLLVEVLGGVIWGVVCGTLIGVVAGVWYGLLGPGLIATLGVVPVGTMSALTVGTTLTAIEAWPRRKRKPRRLRTGQS
jgi:hypothetical protein